jgi:uncharacterized protein YdeI (BOF family)
MKAIVVALIFALLPAWAAAKEQPKLKKPAQTKQKPCSEYGPGFVQVQGTTTCVKVGGSVEAGGGYRR